MRLCECVVLVQRWRSRDAGSLGRGRCQGPSRGYDVNFSRACRARTEARPMNPSTAHPAGSARPRDSPRWRLGPIQFLTHDSIIGPAETDNTSAIPGGGVVRPRLLRAGRWARGHLSVRPCCINVGWQPAMKQEQTRLNRAKLCHTQRDLADHARKSQTNSVLLRGGAASIPST